MHPLSLEDWQDHFQTLVEQGRLAHAYLLTGSDSSPMEDLVLTIAQLLATQGRLDQPVVQERIVQGQYPDVWFLEPEGRILRVDQIRQVRAWATSSPVEGDFKLVYISQAQTMNAAAANALLTLLEEPVAGVYLILGSPAADLLLPTIVSRVQEVHLASDQYESQKHDLQANYDLPEPVADLMVHLAPGAQEALLKNFDLDDFRTWVKNLRIFYRLLVQANPLAFVSVQQDLSSVINQDRGLAALDYLMLLNHQVLMIKEGLPSSLAIAGLVSSQEAEKVKKSPQVKSQDLMDIQDRLLTAKRYLAAHVPAQLVFEQVALKTSSPRPDSPRH